jgi:hypothetical protein
VGILLKLEFIRINFPPKERALPFQPSSLFTNSSSTGSKSITCSLELVTGTPRYFIGQTPVAQFIMSANSYHGAMLLPKALD